jgi:hypothetical protein
MSGADALGAAFVGASLLTAAGFWRARSITRLNGPSPRLARFSAAMAFALGTYLLLCFALALLSLGAGQRGSALVYAALVASPFVIATVARDYGQADAAFNAQAAVLLAGVVWRAASGG